MGQQAGRFEDELPFSFEEMVDNESVVRLFEQFKDCERIKRNENLVFERAFDNAIRTKKKNIKYMAKFIGKFGRLPDVGENIKKIFVQIYSMGVLDEFFMPEVTDVNTTFPLAEDFGFLAVHFYMEDVFSNGDIEKLFNDLAAISTTDTAITILHLRIIFMMILYLPKKYQRCVRKEWIPIFLEQFSVVFENEIHLFGQIKFLETEKKNPHIEEYQYIFDTIVAYFQELAKTEPNAEKLEELKKKGVERYTKYRWEYVEYITAEDAAFFKKSLVENHEVIKQMEEMKKGVREQQSDEELRRIRVELGAKKQEVIRSNDLRKIRYQIILDTEQPHRDRKKEFMKIIADLEATVADPMVQNVQEPGSSSQ